MDTVNDREHPFGGTFPQTPLAPLRGDIPPDPQTPRPPWLPFGGTFPQTPGPPLGGTRPAGPPLSGLAGDLRGVLGGAAADLGAQPDQGVVLAVGHAFLHRDQRVVGDLD